MSNNLVKIDTVYHSKHLHLIKTNHPNMVNKQVDSTKFGMIEKNVLCLTIVVCLLDGV